MKWSLLAVAIVLSLHAGALPVRAECTPLAPPRVVATTPELGDDAVDPGLKEIRIEFDHDMSPRGQSLCGGGPSFPRITGKSRWEGARTVIVPVALEPDHHYALSINCESAQNFRTTGGAPVEIYPVQFRTSKGGAEGAGAEAAAPRPAATTEQHREAYTQLRSAIHDRYSYRDLRAVDWDGAFASHRAALEAAPSRAAFAMEAARLLAEARDIHVTLRLGVARIPTYRANARANCNLRKLPALIPGWKARAGGNIVITGRFDDGIGYIAILTCPGEPADMRPALEALDEFKDAKALIIDLRANSGGAEAPMWPFAGCFLDEEAVYSLNDYRDAQSPTGFGKKLQRRVAPNPAGPRFRAPVAVLIGPAVVSSAESFALMLKANPRATLVGERTMGSSGNPAPVQLANGVVCVLPSWRDYHPDGTILEGRGIEPDLPVKTTAANLEDADPVLDAALRLLRERK